MAPVVEELKALPDSDIRAMASYLASFNDPLPAGEAAARVAEIAAATASSAHPATTPPAMRPGVARSRSMPGLRSA
jgi:nicotinate dehydrogenase subunit B